MFATMKMMNVLKLMSIVLVREGERGEWSEICPKSLKYSKMVHSMRGHLRNASFPNLSEAQIPHLSSFQGREVALTATQVEDFRLQAILEKIISLDYPLFSGPF